MKTNSLLAMATMATMAALAAPAVGADVQIARQAQDAFPMLGGYPPRGKGRGKRPRHASARFVAQDKRDARKARNRRR